MSDNTGGAGNTAHTIGITDERNADPYPPIRRSECECHYEPGSNHEACCGHEGGRNPNCPIHGDGSI